MQLLTATSTTELESLVTKHKEDKKSVIVLFTGTKRAEDGKSWCPDCVVAEPVIDGVVEQLKDNSSDLVFITVPVGDLPTWKSPDNQFRKHAQYAVNCVPTLVNLGKAQRLEEGGCADAALVKALFEGALESGSTTVKGGTCEGGVCRIR